MLIQRQHKTPFRYLDFKYMDLKFIYFKYPSLVWIKDLLREKKNINVKSGWSNSPEHLDLLISMHLKSSIWILFLKRFQLTHILKKRERRWLWSVGDEVKIGLCWYFGSTLACSPYACLWIPRIDPTITKITLSQYSSLSSQKKPSIYELLFSKNMLS